MASDEETFGNLSDLTLLPSLFETIPEFTLDDLFPHTFNDSFAPSNEPIPEMIPQQTEITHGDFFPPTFNDSIAPSIEPIPEMIPQQTEITLDYLFPPTIIAPSIEPIPVMIPQQTEISSSLPEEVDSINSGVVPSAVHGVEVKQLDEEKKVREKVKSKRKNEVWTVKEHGLFLEGLEKYDKGKRSKIWKKISTEFVVSKNPRQVASHAQKFYQHRQKNEEGKRLRRSINDITQ